MPNGDDKDRRGRRRPPEPSDIPNPVALGSEFFPPVSFSAINGAGPNVLQDLLRGDQNTVPLFYNPIAAPNISAGREGSTALRDAISELSGAKAQAARNDADLRRETARRASRNILFSLAPQIFGAFAGTPVQMSDEQRQLAQQMVQEALGAESSARQVEALAPAEAAVQEAQIQREDDAQQLQIDQANAGFDLQAQLQNNQQLQNISTSVAKARQNQQALMVQLGTWSADKQIQSDRWIKEMAEKQYQFDVNANLRRQQIAATASKSAPNLKGYRDTTEKFVTSYNKVKNMLDHIYGGVETSKSTGFFGIGGGKDVHNVSPEHIRSIAASQAQYKQAIDDLQESLGALRGYGLDGFFDKAIIDNASTAAGALSTATRFGQLGEGLNKDHIISGLGAYQTVSEVGNAFMPEALGGLRGLTGGTEVNEDDTAPPAQGGAAPAANQPPNPWD